MTRLWMSKNRSKTSKTTAIKPQTAIKTTAIKTDPKQLLSLERKSKLAPRTNTLSRQSCLQERHIHLSCDCQYPTVPGLQNWQLFCTSPDEYPKHPVLLTCTNRQKVCRAGRKIPEGLQNSVCIPNDTFYCTSPTLSRMTSG